jgi:hypothetical protein
VVETAERVIETFRLTRHNVLVERVHEDPGENFTELELVEQPSLLKHVQEHILNRRISSHLSLQLSVRRAKELGTFFSLSNL